jgi:formiminotetrahydrofolate cyclodeaminase
LSRDFLGLPVKDFLAEIATPEPMPGAGYCAAVTLSMAAGLVAMVAGASRAEWGEAKGAAAQANALRERVAPLAQLNVDAYASAIARLRAAEYEPDDARAEPGSDPSQDLGPLLQRAAQIPLEIAEAAVDVASLAAIVAERGEQALRADAVAGALLAQGAARAAATLVEVNLGTTGTDARVTRVRDLAGSANAAAERALATLA